MSIFVYPASELKQVLPNEFHWLIWIEIGANRIGLLFQRYHTVSRVTRSGLAKTWVILILPDPLGNNITITWFFRAIDTCYWPDADASGPRRSRGTLASVYRPEKSFYYYYYNLTIKSWKHIYCQSTITAYVYMSIRKNHLAKNHRSPPQGSALIKAQWTCDHPPLPPSPPP